MTMSMKRAFSARMLAPFTRYQTLEGTYDADNIWVPGGYNTTTLKGVLVSGNRFSRFEEGVALKATPGGERYSNYKSLYVTDDNLVEVQDFIQFRSIYYRVIQMNDELVFRFRGFIVEKMEDWVP